MSDLPESLVARAAEVIYDASVRPLAEAREMQTTRWLDTIGLARAALSAVLERMACPECYGRGQSYREGTPGPILRGLGYPPDYSDGTWETCEECGGAGVLWVAREGEAS